MPTPTVVASQTVREAIPKDFHGCKTCQDAANSSYFPRPGWICIGQPVRRDRYSTEHFLQCPACGAVWEELDEMDPGNRISEGSTYEMRHPK